MLRRITAALLIMHAVAPPAGAWVEKDAEPWPAECAGVVAKAYRAGGDVKVPRVVSRTEPLTNLPRHNLRCQDVFPVFEILVRADGSVGCVRIIHLTRHPPGEELRTEVRRNVMKWRFRPATLHEKPVDCIMNVTIFYKCA